MNRFLWQFFFSELLFLLSNFSALWNCVGFCQTSTWISHRYTYAPPYLNLASPSSPSHPSRLLQSPSLKSLRHTANSIGYLFSCSVTQLCPTLGDPMDCSLLGSSTHGIFQTRVLEWGAIAFPETHTKNQQLKEKLYKILNHFWWGNIFSLNWGTVDLQ